MSLLVPDGTKVYEADEDQLIHNAWGNRVLTGGLISAQGTPNMTVVISAGSLRYQGAKVTIAAVASLTISDANPTNPRIDLIHVPGGTGAAAVVTGTPAATPKPPPLPAGSILLGYVSVAAAAVNIGSQNISDRRLQQPTGGELIGAELANYLSVTGAAAASSPTITALGSDTDIHIVLTPKGAGGVSISSAAARIIGGATSFSIRDNANANDNLIITNAGAVTIRAGLTVTTGNLGVVAANASLLMTGAGYTTFTPGTSGLLITNNAGSANNLALTDAGAVTVRAGLTVTTGGVTLTAGAFTIGATQVVAMSAGQLTLGVSSNGDTVFRGGSINIQDVTANTVTGSTAVIGGIGNGPAGTAQSGWVRIQIGGANRYVPIWT